MKSISLRLLLLFKICISIACKAEAYNTTSIQPVLPAKLYRSFRQPPPPPLRFVNVVTTPLFSEKHS
uniref:Putative ovule protein n=1 Tax=Solanum chacoense TaxID=4108 RepID=A0A0V0HHH8_SOLCH